MAFEITLHVEGIERKFKVIHLDYCIHQDTDKETGCPSSVTRAGIIDLEVQSNGDTSISDWSLHSFARKSGSIRFKKTGTDATLKEIRFGDAYVVNYKEAFDSSGPYQMTEKFTISAETFKVGQFEHKNQWAV